LENHSSERSRSNITDPYEIRLANPSDAQGIIDCMQSVMSERIYLISEIYLFSERGQKDLIRNRDDLNIVAVLNREVVGTVNIQRGIYKKNRHTASLGIAVKAEHRNRGLGSEMIRRAIRWSAEQNIIKLNLEVFSSNTGAIALYKRLGFVQEGARKNQFLIGDSFVDDVLMTVYPLEFMEK
jgi:Acetyltransferases, including N-acetylases of ribosomal proteins